MKTAVKEVDISQKNFDFVIDSDYSEVYLLIRWHGIPVGHIWLPVSDGKIISEDLRSDLIHAAKIPLKSLKVKDFLGLNWDFQRNPIKQKATIAICTRDRPKDVQRCLEGLKKMPNDGQEILVIDNCPSSDETARIVKNFSKINYLVEEKPGLDYARNRAMRAAQHDIVAFIDDDAIPDKFWLRCLVNAFEDHLVLCVTGLTEPLVLDTPSQRWHELYSPFNRGYEKKVFDTAIISPSAAGLVGAGVNMALKKEAIQLLGPFDEALDAGTITCSGGDTEMFSRILSAGYRIIYNPAALSWHRHRETRKELRKAAFGYGVGVYAFWTSRIVKNREFSSIYVAFQWLIHQIKIMIKSILYKNKHVPLDILLAELYGCLLGPIRYIQARNHAQITAETPIDHE